MSDRPFKVNKQPPVVVRVKTFLEKTKRGELLNTFQVGSGVGCSYDVLRQNNGYFDGYFKVWKQKKYWGKKATITQFKKEVENDNS
jgi:hypothetical protein